MTRRGPRALPAARAAGSLLALTAAATVGAVPYGDAPTHSGERGAGTTRTAAALAIAAGVHYDSRIGPAENGWLRRRPPPPALRLLAPARNREQREAMRVPRPPVEYSGACWRGRQPIYRLTRIE